LVRVRVRVGGVKDLSALPMAMPVI